MSIMRRQASALAVRVNSKGTVWDSLGAPWWTAQAACSETDPEAFFPDKGGSVREAKRVCGGCAIRVACLTAAIERNEQYGIYGGLSYRERRAFRDGRAA